MRSIYDMTNAEAAEYTEKSREYAAEKARGKLEFVRYKGMSADYEERVTTPEQAKVIENMLIAGFRSLKMDGFDERSASMIAHAIENAAVYSGVLEAEDGFHINSYLAIYRPILKWAERWQRDWYHRKADIES